MCKMDFSASGVVGQQKLLAGKWALYNRNHSWSADKIFQLINRPDKNFAAVLNSPWASTFMGTTKSIAMQAEMTQKYFCEKLYMNDKFECLERPVSVQLKQSLQIMTYIGTTFSYF